MIDITLPVVPIPPSYSKNGEKLDLKEIKRYIDFFDKYSVNIMTTVGTSQFNLLTKQEIRDFNLVCRIDFPGFTIAGLQPANLQETLEEIKWYNDTSITSLMILYPERYYDDKTIVNYFHKIADISERQIYIHGMWMRRGSGGIYNYTPQLINKIFDHPNIVGLKEEQQTYELAYELIKGIKDKGKIIIPAGGSMRRSNMLYPQENARTFLSGIGSIYPQIENMYMDYVHKSWHPRAHKVISELEDPFFNVCMKIGWHVSLRECLRQKKLCCSHNRQPWPEMKLEDKQKIKNVLRDIDKKLEDGWL